MDNLRPSVVVAKLACTSARRGDVIGPMPSSRVHRCRFLDHVPHAIESLDVDPSCQRLAVLRANADIEVWSLKRGEPHFCEFRIAGPVDVPVRRVAWGARSPRHPAGRLFTCGLHGLLTEWDLRTLSAVSSWDSGGGAAWTMHVHVASRTMAVGCEDGGCSVFDMADDDSEPTLRHRTPPQGGRLLGVAFSPQGSHLACSAADGSVRVWHVASWQALSRYVLESEGRRKPPLVWSVALLSDLTVVTGDSTGHVCFYDGQHGTLLRRFGSHQADILALAVSRDETRVFAAGVDQKVVCFSPMPPAAAHGGSSAGAGVTRLAAPPTSSSTRGWLIACSRRPHTHDVRALVTYEPRDAAGGKREAARRSKAARLAAAAAAGSASGGSGNVSAVTSSALPTALPMLVSGGIDCQLSLTSLDEFERAPPLKLLPFPRQGSLAIAKRARLLLLHNGSEVNVWQLPPEGAVPPSALEGGSAEGGSGPGSSDLGATPRKLLLLKPKLLGRNVHCAALSDCGGWLVVCHSEVALYRVRLPEEAAREGALGTALGLCRQSTGAVSGASPSVERVVLPAEVREATCCAFSADDRLLLLGGVCGVLQAVTLDAEPTVRSFRAPPLHGDGGGGGGGGLAPRPAIVQLTTSSDGQWVATLDTLRRVHVHSIDGLCYTATAPPLPSPPTALAFMPNTAVLTIACANKQVSQFDVDRLMPTPWGLQHARPIGAVSGSSEVPHAIVFNPSHPSAPILCAPSWLCRVDTGAHDGAQTPPAAAAESHSTAATASGGAAMKAVKARKRHRQEGADPSTGAGAGEPESHVIRSYGGMLLFDFIAPDTALVIEQPWLRVMDLFPPALYKHRFGT